MASNEMRRFIIHFTNINTGDSKDIHIQAPFTLKHAKSILERMFATDELRVNDVTEVNTIVRIIIEPFCLS